MLDHSCIPLIFVGRPAILTNTCEILQNGANMRHGHPVAAVAMLVSGALGLAALIAVAAMIIQETRCTRTLISLHLQRDSGARV